MTADVVPIPMPIPTRDRLVDTARAYLDAEGVDGIGLREIARRAGVSHGAPLRHFPTLGALLAAVAAEGFRDLYASVDAAVRTRADDDPLARLKAAAHGYVDFARAHPGVFALMFRTRPLRHVGPRLRDRRWHRVRSARRARRRRAGRRPPARAAAPPSSPASCGRPCTGSRRCTCTARSSPPPASPMSTSSSTSPPICMIPTDRARGRANRCEHPSIRPSEGADNDDRHRRRHQSST